MYPIQAVVKGTKKKGDHTIGISEAVAPRDSVLTH